MTDPTPEQSENKKRRTAVKVVLSFAILAAATGVLTVTSLALFTDSEAVPGNTFSAGTVDLVTAPTSAVVTTPAMAPGDQVTAPLVVTNSGTLEFRYSLTSTTTEDVLAAELELTVKVGVTTCDNANWTADGTVLYNAGILGSTGTSVIFGDATAGADPGDRVLAAAANETLCFNVTLPLSATNASQGLTTTATFTFDAEQTANNP